MKIDKQEYYDQFGEEWKEFAETCHQFLVILNIELGAGLPVWAIVPETVTEYWMYAHYTLGEALDMCEQFGWEYEVLPPESGVINELLEWKERADQFGGTNYQFKGGV